MGPDTGLPGEVRAFTLHAADPSPIDQAAGFTLVVSWGDGTGTTVTGADGLGLTHAYGQTLDSFSRDRSSCDLGNSPQPAQVFVDPMPIPPQLPARLKS